MVENTKSEKKKPARKQVRTFITFALAIVISEIDQRSPDIHLSPSKIHHKHPQSMQVETPVTGYETHNDMNTYNIWHHRRRREFSTPRESRGVKEKSQYRCHPLLDSGWTRGQTQGTHFCCLYFARGICHLGADCTFLHRVPTSLDEACHRTQPQYDIFGRDKLDEETRTKGVGSINRTSTTLYIYLGGAASLTQETLHELIHKNFEEWGPIEDVKVIPTKAIAFVRYTWRASAEFAKAAMHQQTLTGTKVDHVLDVRWANDDPNPKAQLRVKREQEEAMATAYMNAIEKMEPEQKKSKLYDIAMSSDYVAGGATAAYPDTSHQYNGMLVKPESDGDGGDGDVDGEQGDEDDDIGRYLLEGDDEYDQYYGDEGVDKDDTGDREAVEEEQGRPSLGGDNKQQESVLGLVDYDDSDDDER